MAFRALCVESDDFLRAPGCAFNQYGQSEHPPSGRDARSAPAHSAPLPNAPWVIADMLRASRGHDELQRAHRPSLDARERPPASTPEIRPGRSRVAHGSMACPDPLQSMQSRMLEANHSDDLPIPTTPAARSANAGVMKRHSSDERPGASIVTAWIHHLFDLTIPSRQLDWMASAPRRRSLSRTTGSNPRRQPADRGCVWSAGTRVGYSLAASDSGCERPRNINVRSSSRECTSSLR